MQIGARTFKTGIGILVSLLVSHYIPFISPVLPTITVIFSMQPTVKMSLLTLRDRLFAGILGGVVAIVLGLTLGQTPFIIALGVMILISLLNQLKLTNVIALSTMTMVIIMLDDPSTFLNSAIIRVFESFIGVIIGFIINYVIMPPRFSKKLFTLIDDTTSEILVRNRAILRHNTEYAILNKDMKYIKNELNTISNLYKYMKEESFYSKKARRLHTRKLATFRSLVRSTQVAYRLLDTLHRNEDDLFTIDYELLVVIRERLEMLMSAHEQIILKFSGRVIPSEVNFFEINLEERKFLVSKLFKEVALNTGIKSVNLSHSNTIIYLTAAILEYEAELTKLNRIVRSYKINSWNDSSDSISYEY